MMEQSQINQNPTEKKRWKILGVEFVYLWFFGIGVAFLGWFVENLARALGSPATWDCRFHLLPFISPYGLLPLAFHVALGDPDDLVIFGKRLFREKTRKSVICSNVIAFVFMCLGVFLGELAVGNLWDALFGVKLWDYTGYPLTLTQYTSIVTTLGLGAGAYLLFRFVYKPLLHLIRARVSFKVAKWVSCTLGVAIVLDTVVMIVFLAVFKEAPMYWSISFR